MKTNAFYALHPRSIALIGVSGEFKSGLIGATGALKHLLQYGYPGKLFPVNPKYETVAGLKCYKSLKDIDEPIDMVIIGIAAERVAPALREAGEAGVKTAIIISSGFAEVKGGEALQQEIVDIASEFGIRIIGPNCLGMINSHEKIVTSSGAGPYCGKLSPGNVGLVSQSGALTSCLLPRAEDALMGYSFLISSGNEADLKLTDYLDMLLDDPNTYVIVAYIEGLKDHQRLAELAERALKMNKPFLVFKVGKSERAQASVRAHTGSLAGSNKVQDAFFKQNGIIRLDHLDEVYESAFLLTKKKLMSGNRVAVISMSGGLASISCDVCDDEGLQVPEVSATTQEKLMEVLPSFASAINPVDLSGGMSKTPEKISEVIRILDEDNDIDAICVSLMSCAQVLAQAYSKAIVEIYPEVSKPLIVSWFTGEMNEAETDFLKKSGIPCYDTIESSIKALKRVYQWTQLVSRKQNKKKVADIMPRKLSDYLELTAGQTVLTESQGKTIFSKFGLPVAKGLVVNSAAEAVAAAEKFGYPVVLKVVSAEIAHKSDMGGVKLNLKNSDEVSNAYTEIERAVAATGKKYDGVLVEQMISGGVEVIAGITNDAEFGPTVVFGSGGIYTEVYKDVAMRVCPFDKDEALEMIQETKVYQVLKGIRGKSPYDIEELAATLVKLSEFAVSFREEVKEVDINPLMVREKGQGVVVADALIVVHS